jgi:hypothetical protein
MTTKQIIKEFPLKLRIQFYLLFLLDNKEFNLTIDRIKYNKKAIQTVEKAFREQWNVSVEENKKKKGAFLLKETITEQPEKKEAKREEKIDIRREPEKKEEFRYKNVMSWEKSFDLHYRYIADELVSDKNYSRLLIDNMYFLPCKNPVLYSNKIQFMIPNWNDLPIDARDTLRRKNIFSILSDHNERYDFQVSYLNIRSPAYNYSGEDYVEVDATILSMEKQEFSPKSPSQGDLKKVVESRLLEEVKNGNLSTPNLIRLLE